jgi:hypothetical protein
MPQSVTKHKANGASKIIDTFETNGQLDLGVGEKPVDQKVYRYMIGSLLYLCASRTDIMLSVGLCAHFQSAPKECHFVAVKWILGCSFTLLLSGYGIQRGQALNLWATRIPIGPVTRLTGSRPPGLANSLVGHW